MDTVHKVQFNIRSLSTRSITLFPTRAQVYRDIKDVPLQPGTNEITILGLTPTVDEDSIKVEGSGSAIISNIAIESLPNRDLFEDVYPDSDEDPSDDESDDDEPLELPDGPKLSAAIARSTELGAQVKEANELWHSAECRQKALDIYALTLNSKHTAAIGDTIGSYKEVRDVIYRDRVQGLKRYNELNELWNKNEKEVARLRKLKTKAEKQANKDRSKARVVKRKAAERNKSLQQERQAEKKRVRKERQKFWPKFCYAVHIQLEANFFTPASSRGGSVSSDVEMVPDVPHTPASIAGNGSCDIVLSYVTTSAYWTPSYDLQLSTVSSTGTLCFDAQLSNTTSETWEKCKITLSTSQTSSSNLEDIAPVLEPWNIKLDSKKGSSAKESSLTLSREEASYKSQNKVNSKAKKTERARSELFGVTVPEKLDPVPHGSSNVVLQDYQMQLMLLEGQNKKRMMMARQENEVTDEQAAQRQLQQAAQQQAAQQQAVQQQQVMQMQQMQQMPAPSGISNFSAQPSHQTTPIVKMESDDGDSLSDLGTVGREEHQQRLDFEKSLIAAKGFTTTYDLPGLKTLAPKSSSSKQRIARLNFTNIIFSHTIVAKYKAAAYLSAKLQNTSKLTLLRGPVGVTLDGSFMGRTTLPRCASGGGSMRLSLGIDPAIKVTYVAPNMQRASVGYFTKEDIKIYNRVIRLENTRTTSDHSAKLYVRDQVPVSQDERLRVELHNPKDLRIDGESIPAGEPWTDKEDRNGWGTCEVRMGKEGDVNWLVVLRPGQRVKLPLEYMVATPIGDQAVQA